MLENLVGRYINVKGKYVYLEEYGRGLPIVLIHLAGFDGRIYHDVVKYFPTDKYRLLLLDLPGHGKSEPWEVQLKGLSNASVSFYSDVIMQLANALNLERFIAVGTSVGGDIVLDLSTKAKKLIAGVAANCAARTRTFSEEDVKNAINTDPARTLFFASPNATKSLIERLTWIRSSTRNEILRWDLAAWNSFDIADKLELIRIPLLLLRGEYDPIVTHDMMKSTAEKIKSARFKELKGAGHYAPAENPELYAKEVIQFLEENFK
ncbi:hypothetical protein DJ529_07540 [Sulfolobus sp. C3]|nr:hypothetical protein DJ529_07540 [Sulfolobus sp. C3]